jgi:hypothetical protein
MIAFAWSLMKRTTRPFWCAKNADNPVKREKKQYEKMALHYVCTAYVGLRLPKKGAKGKHHKKGRGTDHQQ